MLKSFDPNCSALAEGGCGLEFELDVAGQRADRSGAVVCAPGNAGGGERAHYSREVSKDPADGGAHQRVLGVTVRRERRLVLAPEREVQVQVH